MFTTSGNKETKQTSNSSSFDYYIKRLQAELSEYEHLKTKLEKIYRPFDAPETLLGMFKGYQVSMPSCNDAITATKNRIEILETMNQGGPITRDQLDLLMKISVCSRDPNISNYSNIIINKSNKP